MGQTLALVCRYIGMLIWVIFPGQRKVSTTQLFFREPPENSNPANLEHSTGLLPRPPAIRHIVHSKCPPGHPVESGQQLGGHRELPTQRMMNGHLHRAKRRCKRKHSCSVASSSPVETWASLAVSEGHCRRHGRQCVKSSTLQNLHLGRVRLAQPTALEWWPLARRKIIQAQQCLASCTGQTEAEIENTVFLCLWFGQSVRFLFVSI